MLVEAGFEDVSLFFAGLSFRGLPCELRLAALLTQDGNFAHVSTTVSGREAEILSRRGPQWLAPGGAPHRSLNKWRR